MTPRDAALHIAEVYRESVPVCHCGRYAAVMGSRYPLILDVASHQMCASRPMVPALASSVTYGSALGADALGEIGAA